MPYTPKTWVDKPSTTTPITATELIRVETGVDTAVDFADTHPVAADPHIQYQKTSQKGAANGYASLDSGGKVPSSQLPVNTTDYSTLPAGTMVAVFKSGSWPARPTSRTDIVVAWIGVDPSPSIVSSGTGGMMDNVDLRFVTP